MTLDVHFSSGKDDWETPDEFFQSYNNHYDFILDAAANDRNHKCPSWFGDNGVEPDALTTDWSRWLERGNIWLNPPYSRSLQSRFVQKAINEVDKLENYEERKYCIVMLLPARTDTKLFHNLILPNCSVEFIKGRIKFVGAEHGAPFPSMICVL